jgi:hypothetical protein
LQRDRDENLRLLSLVRLSDAVRLLARSGDDLARRREATFT